MILCNFRFGLFWNMTEPCIFLKDLELIKKVQVTNYEHFMDLGKFFTMCSKLENQDNSFIHSFIHSFINSRKIQSVSNRQLA